MSKSRIIAATAVFMVCAGQSALAQVFDRLPAEFPPASYTGNQYVDSAGCAFIRAGVSGNVNWVPRVNRDRSQLCGFQPSLTGMQAALPVIPDAPAQIAAVPVAPAIPTVVPPRTAPVRAAPAADPGAPIVTVASITTPPRLNAQPVTPQVIAAPVGPVAPAPRQITRSEACAGRTGVQLGFISSATGNPIDCGPAAPMILTAAPAPVIAAPQAPVRERLTLAEACARIAGTTARLRNADTGAEVFCGMLAPAPLLVAAPAAPMVPMGAVVPGRAGAVAPVVTVMACETGPMSGFDYLNAPPGVAFRCGPQRQSPSGITSGIVARAAQAPARAPMPTRGMIAAAAPAVVTPPPGYETVWDDGRLNPQRGLPQTAVQVAAVAPPVIGDRVSTRVAPPQVAQAPVASGHRFVQVGTFADPANAERTAARLQALGLPVGFANLTRNGTQMRVVAAGPFASEADLQAALRAARGAGFSDAFTRS